MEKILKVIKWLFSFMRMIKYKIIYGKKIIFNFEKGKKPIYIGKNVNIHIQGKGKIILGAGVYLSDYVTLDAIEGMICLKDCVFINTYSRVIAKERVMIGSNCLLGSNVSIYDHDHLWKGVGCIAQQGFSIEEVVIEDDVWLCTNVVITSGIFIKNHNVIGANSVVTKDIIKSGIVTGVPAKEIFCNKN